MSQKKVEPPLLENLMISRRKILKGSFFVCLALSTGALAASPLLGCSRRQYIRKSEKCWIGPPESFFFPAQPALESGIMILRDEKGWSALDGRCTVDSCDLSYNGKFLYCPCCRSAFDLTGKILSPPAQDALKFWRMGFEKDSLIVFAGDSVTIDTRFMTPELEAMMVQMAERYKNEGMISITKPDSDIVYPNKRIDASQFVSDAEMENRRMGNIYNTLNKPTLDRQPKPPEDKKDKEK